jgi:hypothetical protein
LINTTAIPIKFFVTGHSKGIFALAAMNPNMELNPRALESYNDAAGLHENYSKNILLPRDDCQQLTADPNQWKAASPIYFCK